MNPTKLPRKEDEDCITDLPDDIMCRIMSSLPTVDAVRTSVLSKEWENKWTSIYNIDITDQRWKQIRRKECRVAFINFMRRVTSHTTNVRKCSLCLDMDYDSRETKSWISALFRNHIEILHVDTPVLSPTQLVIPGSLLNTTYLKDMVLRGPKFRVPSGNCFTNLRSLRLQYVRISNEKSRSRSTMVLNFPVLEAFNVSNCEWFRVKCVEINAPVLVTFSCHDQKFSGNFDHHIMNIHGNRLAKFLFGGGGPDEIHVIGSQVVTADFWNLDSEDVESMRGSGLRIQRLLKQFACSLDHLMLAFEVAEAILESNQGVSLTSFAKLRKLTLYPTLDDIDDVYGNTAVLLKLLQAMPCLKCLKICVILWDDFDYEAVESIPSCLTSSLEKIKFVEIGNGSVAQLRLAKFLLKTALNLKEFHVFDYRDSKKFVGEISAYPTGSANVKISGS